MSSVMEQELGNQIDERKGLGGESVMSIATRPTKIAERDAEAPVMRIVFEI